MNNSERFPLNPRSVHLSVALAAVTLILPVEMQAAEYAAAPLQAKQRWMDRAGQAAAEEFIGIRASDGVEKDLFRIEPTGASTGPVLNAAREFLDSLTKTQLIHTLFAVDDKEWRLWCNVDSAIFLRQGVPLVQMDSGQRTKALNILRTSLSPGGFQLTEDIRKTDHTLAELNGFQPGFGEDLYYFTVMGVPSESEPWGWQVDGHHLIINYFVLGDQVVMSPVFLGGEPVKTTTGKYAGNHILQQEQAAGLRLVQALSSDQQAAAILTREKLRSSNQAEAFKDNLVLDYEGAPVSNFSPDQKQQLVALIELFVGNLREEHAAIRMEEVIAHLDATWFAWIGDTKDDSVYYYRIHSPVILIEFDHQPPVGTRMLNKSREPTRDHIHVTIRTPNGNDYGKDLLRQHYLDHPH